MLQSLIGSMHETVGRCRRRGTLSFGLVLSIALIVGASPAFAQDDPSNAPSSAENEAEDESASGAKEGGEAEGESEQAEAGQKQATERDKPDPDDPNYWSKVRQVRTVQKRSFQKVGRLAVSAYGGMIPNNIFEQYFPVGLRLNYYILENLGVELAGSYAFSSQTAVEGVLKEGQASKQGIGASGLRLAGIQIAHSNFGLVWSPFYGKVAVYDELIGYFDLYLFGGAGLVVTKAETEFNQSRSDITPAIKPEGVMGAGMAFYFLNNAAVRLDFRQFAFQKTKGVAGVANPSEVSLGVGWFFF